MVYTKEMYMYNMDYTNMKHVKYNLYGTHGYLSQSLSYLSSSTFDSRQLSWHVRGYDEQN